MAGAVHVKRLVGFAGDQFVNVTLEQTQLDQPGRDDPDRGLVRLVPVFVRRDLGERRFLRSQHQFVNRFLFR
ncbi:hypothetical protein D3C78_1942150 [compost metagenome]